MVEEELRKGNLVYYGTTVFTVKGYYNGIVFIDRSRGIVELEIEDLKPILLTEEYLVKFGFKKKGEDEEDNAIHCLNGFEIIKHAFKEEFWIDANIITPYRIRHIHQLQNLYFALTGEELILKS